MAVLSVSTPRPPSSSFDAWDRARHLIPGGVSRDQLFSDPPFFAARGEGSRIFDPAGAGRIDFVNNYTSLIHGHAHPQTVQAIAAQAALGTALGAPSELEARLAQEIVRRLAGSQMVRFTNSGTEATMLAAQIARYVTGRHRIAKFEGGYHGSYDPVRVSVKPEDGGPRERPTPVPEEGTGGFDSTDILPFDDVAAVEAIAAERADQWAALIVEPMQGSAGMLPAPDGLLAACRALADRYGFLLVLDEVMTLRHGGQGLQTAWGIRPDLTTLGKIIGGGLPVGAVAGPAKIMESLAPPAPRRIHHSGTFNGNALTMAAGLATLAAYDETVAHDLDTRGDALRSRLQETLAAHGLSVTGWGSMMNVHATPRPPACWRDVRDSDRSRMQAIQRLLLDRGVYIAPRGLVVLSTAHSDDDLDKLEEAFAGAAVETAQLRARFGS